jgi:hypothetical protein
MFGVMKAFYDGSIGEDENGDRWITLAGVAGTDAVWANFEERWKRMLAERYPVAPYIHMIELLGHDDPFESHVGWDIDKKHELVRDAVVLLSQMDKAGFKMAWSSINESARLRAEIDGIRVPKSAILQSASDCVFLTVGAYMLNVPFENQEPVYIFYDRGERFLGTFKENWLKHRTKPGRPVNPDNWWDCFAGVKEVDMAYHFGIQAADMVAWGHSRALKEEDRSFSWLKEWLVKVVPSSAIEYSEDLLRNLKNDEYRHGWERVFKAT